MGKALIFGANGQDGYYLSEICRTKGIEPICVSRSGDFLHANVSNFNEVDALVFKYLPDYVFHLAANSTTRHDALLENHATIATGTLNILEAVKTHNPNSKVFITGSGLQFVNNGLPISEQDIFEANSPYSVARIHSIYAARYFRTFGLKVYVGYLFHHESPLRKQNHVSQMIVRTAQQVKAGNNEILQMGDISVIKEWTFAGDIANGIMTLVEQDNIYEAVIGSGIAYSIEDWLVICFGLVNKNWKEYVSLNENFRVEYPILVSNPITIKSLGWFPKTSFEQLAKMMMHI